MRAKYVPLLIAFFFNHPLFSQAPAVTSFSPTAGPVGTSVTINGTNFSPTAANNIVFFGAVRATITSASVTTLSATVPAGASFQPITVTTNGLTAFAARPFVVTFTGAGAALAASSFAPKNDYASGNGPSCIATGDLDGDGKPDLISINDTSNTLSVFRNLSTGASIDLSPKTDYSTGNKPYCVSVGDLDGDGKLDLAVANGLSNTISVFRNTSAGAGNISFAPKIDLQSGNFPYCIVIRDMNGDGKPDLAAANSSSNTVSLFKNNSAVGSFSFSLKSDFATGSSPFWLTTGDLDNDGNPDLAVANGATTNSVSVLRNTSSAGNISFATKIDFDGGVYSYSIAIGDMDGDGRPDLTVGNGSAPSVAVLLNASTGAGNISFAPKSSYNATSSSYGVTISDMDGDGKADIVVANSNSGTVSILKNRSVAGTLSIDQHIDYQVGNGPWVAVAVDLDGDGKPDIASANERSRNISILRNKIDEPFITSFDPVSGGNGATINITGGNFNGISGVYFGTVPADTFIVVSPVEITATVGNGSSGNVLVTGIAGADSLNGFSFTTNPTISSFFPAFGGVGTVITILGTNLNTVSSVLFGNSPASSYTINSPSSITAVVGSIDSITMSVTVTNAGGSDTANGFFTGPSITSFFPKSGPIGTIVTIKGFHFNNSLVRNKVFFGTVSALIIQADTDSLVVAVPPYASFDPITVIADSFIAYSKEPFTVTFPPGPSGLNSNSLVLKGDSTTGQYPIAIAKADFDLDGKTDLVTANYLSGSFSVLINNSGPGFISFNPKVDFSTSSFPFKIATGDIDADGKTDIAVLNRGANTVSIFRNTTTNAVISFAPGIEFVTGNSPIEINIRDIDIDGKPDLVILNESAATVSVLRNNGSFNSISFQPKVDFYTMNMVAGLAIGDIDNDGKPDIVVPNGVNEKFTVLRNKSISGQAFSSLSFEKSNPFTTGSSPQDITLADFNRDGIADVAIGNKGSETISVYKNTTIHPVISFADKIDYYFGDNTANSYQLKISSADMDGDGNVDIFFPNYQKNNTILRNSGSAADISFLQPVDCFAGYGYNLPGQHVVSDLDGDGKPDIAVNVTEFNKVYFFRNRVGEVYSMCIGGSMILKAELTGLNYRWQVDSGTGFNDIEDDNNYSGTNSAVLGLRYASSAWYGNQYRCVVDGNNDQPFTLVFANYWIGVENNAWENPSNWSCGKVPDNNTDVVINNGSVVVSSNITVRSLKINPAAAVTVNTGFNLTVLR